MKNEKRAVITALLIWMANFAELVQQQIEPFIFVKVIRRAMAGEI